MFSQEATMALQRTARYATNKQTAEYLGVSTMTLCRWKRAPEIDFPSPSVIGGGNELNDLEKVDEWMKLHRVSRSKMREREAA
jgi:predicted DNA-binding transcriptional regulator AlpA